MCNLDTCLKNQMRLFGLWKIVWKINCIYYNSVRISSMNKIVLVTYFTANSKKSLLWKMVHSFLHTKVHFVREGQCLKEFWGFGILPRGQKHNFFLLTALFVYIQVVRAVCMYMTKNSQQKLAKISKNNFRHLLYIYAEILYS